MSTDTDKRISAEFDDLAWKSEDVNVQFFDSVDVLNLTQSGGCVIGCLSALYG